MTLKENIKSIFNALGMKPTKELTSKEWNAVSEAYQKKYGTSLLDDLASSENDDAGGSPLTLTMPVVLTTLQASVISAEDVDRILGLLEISADSNDQGSQAGIADSVERIVSENRKIRQQLARLAAEAETDDAPPIVSNGKPVAFFLALEQTTSICMELRILSIP